MMASIYLFIMAIFLSIANLFNIGIKGNEINRIVSNIPIQLVKESIIIEQLSDEVDDFVSKIDKELVEKRFKEFLSNSLKNKIKRYYVSFYYFTKDEESGQYIKDEIDTAHAFQFHFQCRYYKNYEIDRHIFYELERLV